MDLSKLNTVEGAEAGHEQQLLHPVSQEPIGIYITVLGKDSKAYRDVMNQQSRSRVTKAQKSGRLGSMTYSLEDVDRDALEVIVACMRSWRSEEKQGEEMVSSDTITIKGEALPINRVNALRVLTEFPWVREQLDTAIADRANFLTR